MTVTGLWTPGFSSIEAAQLFILRTTWSSFLIKGVFIECLLYATHCSRFYRYLENKTFTLPALLTIIF